MKHKLQQIKLVISDVDGVLTDGLLHYNHNGEAFKSFHVRDGLGVRLLMENGIQVALLSGRNSPILQKRMQDLGIKLAILGQLEKQSACYQLMQQANVSPEQTAYIGDDSVDLPAFAVCQLAFAVADAPDYVKQQANYVLQQQGGRGAFREMADIILQAQGKAESFNSAQGFLNLVQNMAQ